MNLISLFISIIRVTNFFLSELFFVIVILDRRPILKTINLIEFPQFILGNNTLLIILIFNIEIFT